MSYWVGWTIPKAERKRLLGLIPAAYADRDANHITHVYGAEADLLLPEIEIAHIIGIADDGAGVQAAVVDMGFARPDGNPYHITWSIDRMAGRKAVESNDVIAMLGFDRIEPIAIIIKPHRYKLNK